MNWTEEVAMETVAALSRQEWQVSHAKKWRIVTIKNLVEYTLAIQENLSSIDWDNPQQALLSLAAIIEKNMGGSSGAVS